MIVGKNRYFLEQRKYDETSADKILFVYCVKQTKNVAIIMLKKAFFFPLGSYNYWRFIKHYEYSMIPYLLAENPELTSKDCFKLSKKMMKGHKFELFKL